MRYLVTLVTLLLVLSISQAMAQQDPIDIGNADSIFIKISEVDPGSGNGNVVADLYFYNDVQDVQAASIGMNWDNPTFVMDSILLSPEAEAAFDVILYLGPQPWPPIDSINATHLFDFSGVSMYGPGLLASPEPKLIARHYFHLENSAGSEQLCIDSLAVVDAVQAKFVGAAMEIYTPIWRGQECQIIETMQTDVDDNPGRASLPDGYALHQNYPNPFNPSTVISYSIPTSGHVSLAVYNSLGQEITILINAFQSAGDYHVRWDGNSASGDAAASGIYFYRLVVGEQMLSRKMIMLK